MQNRSYGFLGESLVHQLPLCDTDCTLTLEDPNGAIRIFPLPSNLGGSGVSIVLRIDESWLVVNQFSGRWLLTEDGEPFFLGYEFISGAHSPPHISSDKRWVLVADTFDYPQNEYRVWDLITQEVIAEFLPPQDGILFILYDIDGFLTNSNNPNETLMSDLKINAPSPCRRLNKELFLTFCRVV